MYRKTMFGDTFEIWLAECMFYHRSIYRINGRRFARRHWNMAWASATNLESELNAFEESHPQMELAL